MATIASSTSKYPALCKNSWDAFVEEHCKHFSVALQDLVDAYRKYTDDKETTDEQFMEFIYNCQKDDLKRWPRTKDGSLDLSAVSQDTIRQSVTMDKMHKLFVYRGENQSQKLELQAAGHRVIVQRHCAGVASVQIVDLKEQPLDAARLGMQMINRTAGGEAELTVEGAFFVACTDDYELQLHGSPVLRFLSQRSHAIVPCDAVM